MTEVGNTTSTSSTSSSATSSTGLTGNYELFLSLLTTQIQNQDPLDPLDSAEYTNQLVQYSSVEQSIQTNANLEEMLATLKSNEASSYVSYLGSEVTAAGGTTMLSDGEASWSYSINEAASGTIEVRNASGAVVYSEEVSLDGGAGKFEWDGVGDSGSASPEGAYTIGFNLKDSSGNAEAASVEISGVVDGVDMSTGSTFLKIGDVSVPVSAVKEVYRAT
ncbi:flagellar hook assembly protein FlgD [Roseibium polysiphoniae]|uniref:Basal-body rod modification protein FlgD n=1 Tax=Roseibium polysiphoniae TaxID=2571221 RepID=A0A944CDQ1_9HYPH|nr:flagellar hook capping FlgD N-terminal domain-containing protein [Roseibium polysiphoniae]MBS8260585.1 flagellar hook assembly protein FlgD [Roseibium polysiphoniae]